MVIVEGGRRFVEKVVTPITVLSEEVSLLPFEGLIVPNSVLCTLVISYDTNILAGVSVSSCPLAARRRVQ